jgi:hypothetical protein
MSSFGIGWKKTLVATLAIAMLVGSATAAIAAAKPGHGGGNHVRHNLSFKDLDEKQWKWAYAHIIRLASKGVFKGYDDGSFKPQNNISRIETLVAAIRLLGLEAEAQKPENMNAKLNFKDFDQLKKKYPQAVGYVAVALKQDLFNENDDKIQPEKPATRLWAAVLLVKGLKLESEARALMHADLPFKDKQEIPAGSVGYVAVALSKGIISGYTDQTFQPNKPVTRAELAAILDRLGVQLPDQGHADGQAIVGIVTANTNGSISVNKADGTTISIPLAADVFIFRDNVKVQPSSIQIGDQVLVRTYEGKAVFIDVTRSAPQAVVFVDSGRVGVITFHSDGKLATISLNRSINGSNSSVTYNVDANVKITGQNVALSANAIVVVRGDNHVVKEIEIIG